MSTLGAGKEGLMKARRHSIELRRNEERLRQLAEINSNEKEKLEYKIAKLENTIKLCKYDLSNPSFASNILIQNKMKNAQEMLDKTLIEYNKLKDEEKNI